MQRPGQPRSARNPGCCRFHTFLTEDYFSLLPAATAVEDHHVAEHRAYIAGLGFALLAAWLLTLRLRYAYATAGLLLVAMAYATVQRNRVWADSLSLWTDTERKSPGLARPHLNLGLAYQSAGRLNAALLEYGHALSLNARLVPAYTNRGAIYFARGDLAAAEIELKKAIELSPNRPAPYINLATIALHRNRPETALEFLDRIAVKDRSPVYFVTRADALFLLGRYHEAEQEYDRSLKAGTSDRAMEVRIRSRLRQIEGLTVRPSR